MKFKYEPYINLRLHLPQQFQLLCLLMKVTPKQVIYEMMCNIAAENFAKHGDEQKQQAKEYFISCGYGQHLYKSADISTIFKELEAVGRLFPNDASIKQVERHCKWRNDYYQYWFKKWYRRGND